MHHIDLEAHHIDLEVRHIVLQAVHIDLVVVDLDSFLPEGHKEMCQEQHRSRGLVVPHTVAAEERRRVFVPGLMAVTNRGRAGGMSVLVRIA